MPSACVWPAAHELVAAGFQGQRRDGAQGRDVIAGTRQHRHVAFPGRAIQRPGQHVDEQLGRHVEQAVDVRVLAIEVAGPAHGKLAQQTLLHLGVEARARHAISQELKQGRVDASSAARIVRRHRGRSARRGASRAASAPASAATASARRAGRAGSRGRPGSRAPARRSWAASRAGSGEDRRTGLRHRNEVGSGSHVIGRRQARGNLLGRARTGLRSPGSSGRRSSR